MEGGVHVLQCLDLAGGEAGKFGDVIALLAKRQESTHTRAADAAFASSQLMQSVMLFIIVLCLLPVQVYNSPKRKWHYSIIFYDCKSIAANRNRAKCGNMMQKSAAGRDAVRQGARPPRWAGRFLSVADFDRTVGQAEVGVGRVPAGVLRQPVV